MQLGNGVLITQDGRELRLNYQFGNTHGDTYAGYLLCDTSRLDPATLMASIKIICDDGTAISAVVTHSSDRHVAFIGRVLEVAV